MNQDLFNNLPSEIIINVLSRLPVRSVARCKCVCKPWLRLLETNEFVNIHLSKSLPGLLLHDFDVSPTSYIAFDLEDGPNLQSQVNKPITKFNLPNLRVVHGSSDGLLFLRDHNRNPHDIYICNPITRDCIKLDCPHELVIPPLGISYGFGKSDVTGQHKLVKISRKYGCQVYTLGTGSWRTIAPEHIFRYDHEDDDPPANFNGNLHWLVSDSNGVPWVSCFNLETERFTAFATPALTDGERFFHVHTFGDYLCLFTDIDVGYESSSKKLGIWLMKEYGVENSWTKVEDESLPIMDSG